MKSVTYQEALKIIEGGEDAVLRFPTNWEAIRFVGWLRQRGRELGWEKEVYRCPSTQLRYSLGECNGTSVVGFEKYRDVRDVLYNVRRKAVVL